MRIIHTLLFIITLLCTPAAALAEEPADVTGLKAEWVDGTIKLTWDALESDDIAYYEIFYSHDSILSNDGEYDDFEITDGPEPEFTFTDIPPGAVLYFSVMAVNIDGEEGELFTEEISFVVPDEEATPAPEDEEEPVDSTEGGEDSGDDSGGSVITHDTESSVAATSSSSVNDVESSIPIVEVSSSSESMEMSSSQSEEGPEDEMEISSESASSISSSESEASSSAATIDDGKVHLLSTEAVAATEVLLTFSHPVTVKPEEAPQAFLIIDPLGSTLAIRQVTIDGSKVRVTTDTQEKGRVYQMQLSDPLTGMDGQSLDQVNRVAFFTGNEAGTEPGEVNGEPTIPNIQNGTANDVTNLELSAESRPDKLYVVTAKWKVNMDSIPDKYIFQQTLDGGATFGEPQVLNGGISGVELHGVVPGVFGLRVQAMNSNGVPSAGVFQTISLAGNRATVPVSRPPTASVLPQPTVSHGDSLADTGAGMGVLAFGLIGALAGLRHTRKKA